MFLIDKSNESCQKSKNLKEMSYPGHKKILKRKGNSILLAKTNASISQISRPKINNSSLSNEKQRP